MNKFYALLAFLALGSVNSFATSYNEVDPSKVSFEADDSSFMRRALILKIGGYQVFDMGFSVRADVRDAYKAHLENLLNAAKSQKCKVGIEVRTDPRLGATYSASAIDSEIIISTLAKYCQ